MNVIRMILEAESVNACCSLLRNMLVFLIAASVLISLGFWVFGKQLWVLRGPHLVVLLFFLSQVIIKSAPCECM